MDVSRSLVTVLFTDIVGSTERAAELGDDAWGELLARHDGAVRDALERCGGREVSTAGDGFLASFPEPDHAIRCACTIRESVHALGLRIRAGLHAGEVERSGRAVGGIAVHIGARVAALAGPDEVLVSSTVHDLVAGSGFGFVDRGEHELKGVPGRWRVWAVTSEPARLPIRRPMRGLRDRLAPTRRRSITLGITVASLVFGALGLHVILQDRGRTLAPAVAVAESAAPGIAVLPFQVNDPELELLRQGMVDLLSTDLDGAAGLRAIDSRTVLARWGEHARGETPPDLATALRVARLAGARYALIGSAVTFGGGVRLSTEIYDAQSGRPLGRAQVEGPLDQVFGMVDRLSIETLTAILRATGQGEIPGLSLASVTTDSLEAMKAFLEGEALFRRSDFRAAAAAYERAVGADSLFALAFYRLACAIGWSDYGAAEAYLRRAALLEDRLPERDVLFVRGYLATERGRLAGRELLERAVRLYPDDAEAWFLLGELYFHLGAQALVPSGEADRAFRKSVALDPTFTPAYIHLLDTAVGARADSAEAAEIVRTYERIAARTPQAELLRLTVAVAFGDGVAADRVRDSLAGLGSDQRLGIAFPLTHPRLRHLQEEVLLARPLPADAREAEWILGRLAPAAFAQGRIAEGLAILEDPRAPGWLVVSSLYAVHSLGLDLPPGRLETALASRPSERDVSDFYAAAYAADRGRWNDQLAALERMRADAAGRLAARDTVGAAFLDAAADAADAYAVWRRGDRERARPELESAQGRATGLHERAAVNATIRHWLGELEAGEGDGGGAVRWLSPRETPSFRPGFPYEPFHALRLAGLHARLGNEREAAEASVYVRESWEAADPALRAAVRDARAGPASADRP